MKAPVLLLIALCGCIGLAATDEIKVYEYEDSEIKAIYEKYVDQPKDGLLNIVPSGEVKSLAWIFKTLGLAPKRLGKPTIEGRNMVDYYIWQVSPGFRLSIMIANNDPGYKRNKEDTLKLRGYGVRLQATKAGR